MVVDGIDYEVNILELTRSFAVADSNNSGRTLDGAMFRDIIGTYYNYKLKIEPKDTATYDALYQVLSAPTPSHNITLPYAQTTLTFDAYVTSGDDTLIIRNNVNIWSGLTINFVAKRPTRYAS